MNAPLRRFRNLTLRVILASFTVPVAAHAAEAEFDSDQAQGLVATYCLACHNDALASGGFSLQQINFTRVGEHAEALEKVVKKLRAQMMPPAGMPRPTPAAYQKMSGWLEAELDKAWLASPDPGRISPIQRMNRFEYNNSINELLGLDVNVMSLLPGDPTADGSFDNMASSLPFTTAHLERYMSVARDTTRLATGLPPIGPSSTSYEVPLFLNQDWRQNEDMPFGSRGGLAVDHHFPVDGEYVLRVQLERNYQDYIKGLGWPQQLDIRLDGRLLRRFEIGGEAPGTPAPLSFSGTGEAGSIAWEQYMLVEADEGLEIRLPVTAGSHRVSVSFVRQHLQPEKVPQPVQGGRLYANDEAYLDNQKVHLLEIAGPYSMAPSPTSAERRQQIFSCYPVSRSEEPACASAILSRLARQAYRRSVSDDELERLLGFFREGRENGGGFAEGIQFALEYLLSDPEFLVRSYREPADLPPNTPYPISDLELASRLAFFLWSSAPDEDLLQLAESGQLSDPQILERQVSRMLADPRARATLVDDFAAQWLNLRRLDEVQINTVVFPEYDKSLIDGFRRETELFVASSLKNDASVMELIDADYTFVNERLARHYGIPGVYGSRFRRVELPDTNERGGLLAQGALLTVTSYPGRTSPVLRGKWLLDNLLGTPPPPPPPNVPILPESEAGAEPASIRERLARHREDPICSSCHNVIDPLGFALENFDVIGAWREYDEVGNPVDPNGNYPGGIEFSGFTDLRDWMAGRQRQFAHNLTEKLMTYALGRRVDYYDQPVVRRIVREASSRDYRWSSLIWGIVSSEPFLMSKTADDQQALDSAGKVN